MRRPPNLSCPHGARHSAPRPSPRDATTDALSQLRLGVSNLQPPIGPFSDLPSHSLVTIIPTKLRYKICSSRLNHKSRICVSRMRIRYEIIIGYVSNICSSIKVQVVKPVRIVSFVFQEPRLDSSPFSLPFNLFFSSPSFVSLSRFYEAANRSGEFSDTLYLAYFDLPEIHRAVQLDDVRCYVWHAAFQTRTSGSSHIPRWSRPRMKEEGAGGM